MTLGIYGNGSLGAELFVLARKINIIDQRWSGMVFIDDRGLLAKAQAVTFAEAKSEFAPDQIEFCIAVGEPAVRAELYERIRSAGYRLATLVHPQVQIPENTLVGAGTVINSGCFISCGVSLGDNVFVQPTASIGHDSKIGNHSVISTFVSLAGNCHIGARTFIGMNVPVKEEISIGDDVIIGMGSVVLRNIDDGMVALGNPARPMSVNVSKRVFRK